MIVAIAAVVSFLIAAAGGIEAIPGAAGKPSVPATNPIERAALEDFYRSTAGPAWKNNNGWLAGDPCQTKWYGVICSESGSVIELKLPDNQLAGEIPRTISNLGSLKVLELRKNAIGGILPQEIFSMKSLAAINFNDNRFGGTLPSEISMPVLQNFSFSNNQLVGYLPLMWNSPNTEVIALGSNMIQGPLPTGLSSLSKLRYLDLSQNLLTGDFPSEYGLLRSLKTLLLFTNRFEDPIIPESWDKMVSMQNFQADNLAGDLPKLIGEKWKDLETLVIVNGKLTGAIPTSFCQLEKIRTLHIFRNVLIGSIPDCLCQKPLPLTSINLSYNQLTGEIPNCFQNFEKLQYFYMENNNLTGSIPTSLAHCTNLYTIDLSNNFLTGSVPSIYSNLKSLTWFELDSNRLNLIEDGLEDFFESLNRNFCSMYGNPFSCPLPTYFLDTQYCSVRSCSKCNTGDNHKSCQNCLSSTEQCGWCSEGPNCLEGYTYGPWYPQTCKSEHWVYGNATKCS